MLPGREVEPAQAAVFCNDLELGTVSDGEVRFAKAVATPYLSHCKGTGEWAHYPTTRYASLRPSPHPICRVACALGSGYSFSTTRVRFAKAVATPYLSRCKTMCVENIFRRRDGTR